MELLRRLVSYVVGIISGIRNGCIRLLPSRQVCYIAALIVVTKKPKKVAKGLREYDKVMGKVRKYLNDYGLMPEDRMNELLLMINNAEFDFIIDGPELTTAEKRERMKEITSMKRMYDTASRTADDYRRLDTWFNTEYISIFG